MTEKSKCLSFRSDIMSLKYQNVMLSKLRLPIFKKNLLLSCILVGLGLLPLLGASSEDDQQLKPLSNEYWKALKEHRDARGRNA